MLSIEVTANSQTKNILEDLNDNDIIVNISASDLDSSITINTVLKVNEPLKLKELYSNYQGVKISQIVVKNGSTELMTLSAPDMSWNMSYTIDRLTEQISIVKNI